MIQDLASWAFLTPCVKRREEMRDQAQSLSCTSSWQQWQFPGFAVPWSAGQRKEYTGGTITFHCLEALLRPSLCCGLTLESLECSGNLQVMCCQRHWECALSWQGFVFHKYLQDLHLSQASAFSCSLRGSQHYPYVKGWGRGGRLWARECK